MTQAESTSESSSASAPPYEFTAEFGELLRVPEAVHRHLSALGTQRVRVTLSPDDRPTELVVRGIDASTVDAIAAISGLEGQIVVRALGTEGSAGGAFAERLRARTGDKP